MIRTVIKSVDRDVARFNPDLARLRAQVHRLTTSGVSAAKIADLVGISERHVQRIQSHDHKETVTDVPRYQYDDSDERAAHLDQLVNAAVDLALRVRDEDPGLVWEVLSRLDRTQLQELTQVCLAGIPVDQTKNEIWGWML